jgi:hypothetical protein
MAEASALLGKGGKFRSNLSIAVLAKDEILAQKGAASSQRKARQTHFNENVHEAMEYSPGSPAAKQARASLNSFKKKFNERMSALAATSKKISEMDDVQAATMIQRAERGKRARKLLEARKEQLRDYAETTYICSQLRTSSPPTPAATTVVEQYDSDDKKPAPIVVPHFTLGQLKQSSFFRDDGGINWDCSALSHIQSLPFAPRVVSSSDRPGDACFLAAIMMGTSGF